MSGPPSTSSPARSSDAVHPVPTAAAAVIQGLDERFKAQEERFEARSKAQDVVIQGLLTILGATVENAAGGQTRVVVKTGAAGVAPDGEKSATAELRARRRRRSSLLGGGKLEARVVPVSAKEKEDNEDDEEDGGGRGAGGQALVGLEGEEGAARTTAGAGIEGTATDGAGGDAPGGVDDAPAGRMMGLQAFLMCTTLLPSIGFHGIGPLWLDYAPSHLMGWGHAPIAAMSIVAHWLVTAELSEAPGRLEEVNWLGLCVAWACTMTPYYVKQGFEWLGLGWAVWCIAIYVAVRVTLTRIRDAARAHHLHVGTLGQLVDGTFLTYLEFMVVIAYGFLSSVSCLAAVEPDDSTDLLDEEMWGECGPVTMVR